MHQLFGHRDSNETRFSAAGRAHSRGRAIPLSLRFTVAALAGALGLAASGCMLDFDQFEGSTSETDTSVPGDVPPDSGSEVDGDTRRVDGDSGVPQFDLGASCEKDSECGPATCYENYCTTACDSDGDCPAGGVCVRFGDARRCAVECPERGECSIEGRDDIGCARTGQTGRVGTTPDYDSACVPDTDDDRVADAIDNCPETANARQRNVDGDATGDACDDAPRCHAAASDGAIEFGSTEYPAQDYAAPQLVSGDWLPVLGGVTSGGENGDSSRSDGYVRLDFESGSWETGTSLPYPADQQVVAPIASSSPYVATPGNSGSPDAQYGRLLKVQRDGTIGFDGGFDFETDRPVAGTTGYGDLIVLDYRTTSGGTIRRRIYRKRPGRASFNNIDSETVSEKRDWWVTRDFRGRLYFYTAADPDSMSPAYQGRILQVTPTGRFDGARTYPYPEITDSGGNARAFEPILVPGPGGDRLYAFDRSTGKAAIVDLPTGSVTRASKLDLSLPFDVERAAVQPRAPALVLIGRNSEGSSDLAARAYFPYCNPNFHNRNSDGDSVPDFKDNCPESDNQQQADADEDGIGDSCDNDPDNDGIPNSEEDDLDLTLDTDNDGTANGSDDDVDGDGIPDDRDYYPYDTDNDGIPNHIDDDDDGDGYSDMNERTAGADALDPSDFPNIGEVAFVSTPTDGDARTVKAGPVGDLKSPREVIASGSSPHAPRFFEEDSGIVALAGAPGETQKIIRTSQASGGMSEADLGTPIRGVLPRATSDGGLLTEVAVIKEANPESDASAWEIASQTLGGANFSRDVGPFREIVGFDGRSGTFAFIGGSASCTGCLSVFRASSGGSPQFVGAPPGALQNVRFIGGRYGVVTDDSSDGDGGSRAFVGGAGNLSEIEGDDFAAFNSIAPLDFDGHLIASARRDGNSFNLWLYNANTDRWHRIRKTSEDLIEVDWIR